MDKEQNFKVQKTEEAWKKKLGAERYAILRRAGTERPFTGEYNMLFENGVYHCGACDSALFESTSKFDGHCGWPSFDAPIEKGAIVEKVDKTLGMMRTEILCGSCGSHLGHVFNDGPTDTGVRYCVNSLSLGFDKKD